MLLYLCHVTLSDFSDGFFPTYFPLLVDRLIKFSASKEISWSLGYAARTADDGLASHCWKQNEKVKINHFCYVHFSIVEKLF